MCVVELFDPVYDAEAATLRYKARILEEPDHSYAVFNERHDGSLSAHFGAVALLIEDCADGKLYCCKSSSDNSGDACCTYTYGCCWFLFSCEPCHGEPKCEDHCPEGCQEECGNIVI